MTPKDTGATEADDEADEADDLVELTVLVEEIGATLAELLADLEEAADLAIAVASEIRAEYPAEAARTTEIARRLANIRTGLDMDWRAVPDLPFEV